MKTPKPAPAKMVSLPICGGVAVSQALSIFKLQDQVLNRTLHNFIEVTHGAEWLPSVDSPRMQPAGGIRGLGQGLRF